MFDAQLLMAEKDGMAINTSTVYGPWMSRGADNAQLTLEVIALENAQIVMRTFHKNADETGNGSPTGTSITRTTAGRQSATWTDLKELVRYEFSVSAVQDGDAWCLFRVLDAVWYDDVLAS